ncbi:Hypothetical predicted protein [Mytilus galloprovincialis]|uniref:Uncharacterized protein n=1 Tax=Mytilus galloprovincialis TaxID=29158 RepID=A0A8B6F5F6_MYTGA|nr:Hypothetical predicted protein [Mytilus galloprovincialis]
MSIPSTLEIHPNLALEFIIGTLMTCILISNIDIDLYNEYLRLRYKTDDFLNIWKEEATAALSIRAAGVNPELFKVFEQRKVISLICQDSPGDWEKLMQNLPFVKKMFDRCNFELTTLTKL